MNIPPLKQMFAQLRSLSAPSISRSDDSQTTLTAQVTHIKWAPSSTESTTQTAIPTSDRFIVTINTGSRLIDLVTDISFTVGETLTLIEDAQAQLHLVSRLTPTLTESIKALVANLASRQDSLIPLLKTLDEVMKSVVMQSLMEDPSVNEMLQQTLTQKNLNRLAGVIQNLMNSDNAINKHLSAALVKSGATSQGHESQLGISAFAELTKSPYWPDLAATLLALKHTQTQRFTSLTADGIKSIIQGLSNATSSAPVIHALYHGNLQESPSLTSLLFRLVAILEVQSSSEKLNPSHSVLGTWYQQWRLLNTRGWAPSLPEFESPHQPWLPPVTQLYPIEPRHGSTQIPQTNWLEGLIKILLHQSVAALSRLTTHHLLHQQNRQDAGPVTIQMDIPIHWNGQWTQANLHVKDDTPQEHRGSDKQRLDRKWSLHLSFNFDQIGAVVVQCTLQNHCSRGTVWIENTKTFTNARRPFAALVERLEKLGIKERNWTLQQGLPSPQLPALTTQLVDIRT